MILVAARSKRNEILSEENGTSSFTWKMDAPKKASLSWKGRYSGESL